LYVLSLKKGRMGGKNTAQLKISLKLRYRSSERWVSERYRAPERLYGPMLTRHKEDKDKVCNVLRIRGPTVSRLTSSSADLIVVQVWGADPTLEGKKLHPKTMIHIKKGIELAVKHGSVVDLLYIAVPSKGKK
jgi:hypothetical protein